MAKSKLSVLIVGCGNIAGGFDSSQSQCFPLTHAGAFFKDTRFEISGCIEPDAIKRQLFKDKWKIESSFSDIEECIQDSYFFDIISICTPTPQHKSSIRQAIKLNPKLIFCEKPVTYKITESEVLLAQCKKNDILFGVNFNRRWDVEVIKLRNDLVNGTRGALRMVSGIYNKGLMNNGSHMLDLLHYLLGPLKITSIGNPVFDYWPDDPSVPFCLESKESVPISINCTNSKDYSIFEIQLAFETGILTMEDGGMFWNERKVVSSNNFRGYSVLEAGVRREGSFKGTMSKAVDNIWHAIEKGEPMLSNGQTSLETQVMCEKLKLMLSND